MTSLYWDTCVFIDCLQQSKPDRVHVLRAIIDAAKQSRVQIVTSALTIAEVARIDDKIPASPKDVEKIKAFFENEFIVIRQLDRATAELAAEIGQKHRIRPPDAVHIATAVRARCTLLHTYDGAGDPSNPKRLLFYNGKIGKPPLEIAIPCLGHIPSPPQKKAKDHQPNDRQRDLFDSLDASVPCFDGVWFLRRRHQVHPLRTIIRLSPRRATR